MVLRSFLRRSPRSSGTRGFLSACAVYLGVRDKAGRTGRSPGWDLAPSSMLRRLSVAVRRPQTPARHPAGGLLPEDRPTAACRGHLRGGHCPSPCPQNRLLVVTRLPAVTFLGDLGRHVVDSVGVGAPEPQCGRLCLISQEDRSELPSLSAQPWGVDAPLNFRYLGPQHPEMPSVS